MELLAITSSNLERLLVALAEEGAVYVPGNEKYGSRGIRAYRRLAETARLELPGMVLDQSLREFVLPPREELGPAATEGSGDSSGDDGDRRPDRRIFVCGVKACDLAALKCLDAALGGGNGSMRSASARREALVLLSSDCTAPDEYCHCSLLGGTPWPREGFDLNLSPVDYGYVVEVGSDRGRYIAERNRALFTVPSAELTRQRDETRQWALKTVEDQNEAFRLSGPHQDIIRGSDDSTQWNESMRTCVQCCACMYVCPTSHETIVCERPASDPDKDGNGEASRARTWDCCFRPSHGEAAEPGAGRSTLREQFIERFHAKFDRFFDAHGRVACTGCGRCIRACLGHIDIRQVFKSLDG